jgi:hypothetical protein
MPRSPGTGESGAGQDAQMPRSPGTGESGAEQDAQNAAGAQGRARAASRRFLLCLALA